MNLSYSLSGLKFPMRQEMKLVFVLAGAGFESNNYLFKLSLHFYSTLEPFVLILTLQFTVQILLLFNRLMEKKKGIN